MAVDKKGKPLISWLSVKANTKVAKLVLLNTGSKITEKAPCYKVTAKELGIELKH